MDPKSIAFTISPQALTSMTGFEPVLIVMLYPVELFFRKRTRTFNPHIHRLIEIIIDSILEAIAPTLWGYTETLIRFNKYFYRGTYGNRTHDSTMTG